MQDNQIFLANIISQQFDSIFQVITAIMSNTYSPFLQTQQVPKIQSNIPFHGNNFNRAISPLKQRQCNIEQKHKFITVNDKRIAISPMKKRLYIQKQNCSERIPQTTHQNRDLNHKKINGSNHFPLQFRKSTPTKTKQSPTKPYSPNCSTISNGSRMSVQYLKKCQICYKRKQSYIIRNEQLKMCSNCALQKMKAGKDVQPIQENHSVPVQQADRKNTSPNCKKVRQKCVQLVPQSFNKNQKQMFAFINNVAISQQKIQTTLLTTEQKFQKIRQQYLKRRQLMKQHYQKLKQTIQLSIKKDLQILKQEEQNAINQIQKYKKQLTQDKRRLQQMRQDIEPNVSLIIKSVQQKIYGQFMGKHTADLLKVSRKLQQSQCRHPFQMIESKNFVAESWKQKQYLYNPQIYMMNLKEGQSKNKSNSNIVSNANLFSFQDLRRRDAQ